MHTVDEIIEMFHNVFEHRAGILYRNNKEAGGISQNGYKRVWAGGKRYQTHRVIFAMHHGYFPKLVDHIDRDKLNNKIENLREATNRMNVINSGLSKNNKSGVKGVLWDKSCSKWHAQITNEGVKIGLGRYSKLLDAVEARLQAESELHSDVTTTTIFQEI